MKKKYIEPQMDVVELKHRCTLLAGSVVGSNVYNEDADNNEYGLAPGFGNWDRLNWDWD